MNEKRNTNQANIQHICNAYDDACTLNWDDWWCLRKHKIEAFEYYCTIMATHVAQWVVASEIVVYIRLTHSLILLSQYWWWLRKGWPPNLWTKQRMLGCYCQSRGKFHVCVSLFSRNLCETSLKWVPARNLKTSREL